MSRVARLTPFLLGLAWAAGAAAQPGPPRLVVAGEGAKHGIYDPSVEYAAGGTTGWLAYSAVFGDLQPWGPHVETHLATSPDAGASWSFHGVLLASLPGQIERPDGELVDGVWNAEVPSLVHDPGDPGREWKLFAHRIFRRAEPGFTGEQNEPAYSWIVSRSAPDPAGPWSPEEALFGSGPLPPAPYGFRIAINSLDPSLEELLVYSEPGAFERDGVLYLSLTGLVAQGPDRIVLLASDDHGASWRYVATPADNADAAALGFAHFDGSAIAAQAGRAFLLVTPKSPSALHDGTLVLEFADLPAGELVRDAAGAPLVRKHVPIQPAHASEVGGGQADFHARDAGGLLMPQIDLPHYPEFFRVFATGERLVDPPPLPAAKPLARGAAAAGLLLASLWRTTRRGASSYTGPAARTRR